MKYTITNATAKGARSYQEDRFIVFELPQGLLLGVFDGHGGDDVAEFCRLSFPFLFAKVLEEHGDDPRTALLRTFYTLNHQTEYSRSGSTASVVFITKSLNAAYTAVLGDSPILIKDAKGSIWQGPDHNVRSNTAEAKAAVLRGGMIRSGYLMESYYGSGLQMARALGDANLSKVLNREPEIDETPLGPGSFVLVATDGVFDPAHKSGQVTYSEIAALVDVGIEADGLVDRAVVIPTGDNATAILVRIQ